MLRFRTQLEIMQAQVDMLNEKYEKQIEEAESSGTHFAELGKDLSQITIQNEPLTSLNGANILEESEIEKYRYYDKTTLDSLSLTDMEIEFLVNIKDRKVIALGGFEHKGNKYYTLEQIEKSPDIGGLERGEVSIGDISYEEDSNSGYIIKIEDIKCSKYVKKYTVKYRKSTDTAYKTADTNITYKDFSFKVTTDSKYYVQIIDAAGVMKEVSIYVGDVIAEKPEVSEEKAFSRQWGVIEVEFLEGTTYHTTDIPNEPNMTDDMKAVYWENGEEKVEGESPDFDKEKWYEYIAQSGNTETGGTSKWANAKTEDGSYWVWIPRYAYRIVYFDTEAHRDAYRADNTQTDGIIGYSDARGLVDIEGKTPSDLQEPVTGIVVGKDFFRPHPAFEDGSKTGFTQGEWDSKLEGIWVAKYEMSMEKEDVVTVTDTYIKGNVLINDRIKVVSKPGVPIWRYITIGNMYTNGYNYDRNKDSHLMKNSEWGAIAYLTDSKYGRNGTMIERNKADGYYTAGANEATPLTRPLQSTTGNEYGIFDIAGGSYEYVSGYIADSGNNNGNSFASIDNTTNNKNDSTKYATVYKKASSNEKNENYEININKIFGDATIETSILGTGNSAWNKSSGNFIYNMFQFFQRGGTVYTSVTGEFNFSSDTGGYFDACGFRINLVVK